MLAVVGVVVIFLVVEAAAAFLRDCFLLLPELLTILLLAAVVPVVRAAVLVHLELTPLSRRLLLSAVERVGLMHLLLVHLVALAEVQTVPMVEAQEILDKGLRGKVTQVDKLRLGETTEVAVAVAQGPLEQPPLEA